MAAQDRMNDTSGQDRKAGLSAPITGGFAVTPADGSDISFVTRALWVGGAGNVKVDLLGGETVTLEGVPAGTYLPLRVTRVYSTGTTATKIVGLD